MSDVQAQTKMTADVAQRVREAKRELDSAILDLQQAAGIVGRGPGGSEMSTAIQYARTASGWVREALGDQLTPASAPSNHGQTQENK